MFPRRRKIPGSPLVWRKVTILDIPVCIPCQPFFAKLPKQEKEIPLPLKHTDVKGDICGYIATVEVTQQFQNPYGEKIEAVYVFPLPDNAAVNEFIMIIMVTLPAKMKLILMNWMRE